MTPQSGVMLRHQPKHLFRQIKKGFFARLRMTKKIDFPWCIMLY